jgi:hypothetical protein
MRTTSAPAQLKLTLPRCRRTRLVRQSTGFVWTIDEMPSLRKESRPRRDLELAAA